MTGSPIKKKKSRIEESELIQTIVCGLGKVKRSRNDLGRLVYAGFRERSVICDTWKFFQVDCWSTCLKH